MISQLKIWFHASARKLSVNQQQQNLSRLLQFCFWKGPSLFHGAFVHEQRSPRQCFDIYAEPSRNCASRWVINALRKTTPTTITLTKFDWLSLAGYVINRAAHLIPCNAKSLLVFEKQQLVLTVINCIVCALRSIIRKTFFFRKNANIHRKTAG